MANKRMFSLSVVDTDLFLEMPVTSRLLYYELGMRADDDGFIGNWKKIMRMASLSEDDMKILIAKKFIIPFESGVIVIKHWKMNNYLRSDRYTPTVYKEEFNSLQIENDTYELVTGEKSTMLPSGIPSGIPMVYTGKDSIDNIYTSSGDDEERKSDDVPLEEKQALNDFELIWKEYPRKEGKSKAFNKYKSWLKGKKYLGQKTKLSNEQMWDAVQRYSEKVKDKDKQYIKQGSTFFGDDIMEFVEGIDDG